MPPRRQSHDGDFTNWQFYLHLLKSNSALRHVAGVNALCIPIKGYRGRLAEDAPGGSAPLGKSR